MLLLPVLVTRMSSRCSNLTCDIASGERVAVESSWNKRLCAQFVVGRMLDRCRRCQYVRSGVEQDVWVWLLLPTLVPVGLGRCYRQAPSRRNLHFMLVEPFLP